MTLFPAVRRIATSLASRLLPAPAQAPGATLERHPDGLELRRGRTVLRIAALRDDVLRLRIGRDGSLPEDASWAVLPEARRAHVLVRHEPDGFTTASVRVRMNPRTGALAISDLSGRMILADATDEPFAADGEGFHITRRLPADMHVFGLGEKAGALDRRGRGFAMWNTDAYRYQESTDSLYKSIPFFIGFQRGRAHGVFLDSSFRTSFEFGVRHPDRLSFGAEAGPIDSYVMTGPTPKAVQQAYAWLTGPPPLPPLWSFGHQQSRYSYMSAAEARTVAARLRHERIPADVLWFDIDVLDRNRPFTIDPEAFPDFPALVRELESQGFRSVVITDLHVPYLPGPHLPGEGFAPYESGVAGDHFVRGADGRIYVGTVWPGPCAFPDFTRKATRDWWGTLLRTEALAGVAGIWNDMNEPSVSGVPTRTMPLDVVHRIEEPGFAPRRASHREIHNVFGMQNARATYDGMLALDPDRRPFVMTRASYAGGHRNSVTWTGDNSSSWNHLRMSTPMLLSLGLGGFAFAGCDLGGFAGSPPAALLTRWLQLGMFNPISRNHTDKGTNAQEPWVDGEAHTAIRRRFIEERYRLLPYIYTLAEEASRTGLPMMRPLFMEFPDAADGYPLDLEAGHQFMWGSAMLVAPAPFPEAVESYQVILPPGDWYDYWSGARIIDPAPAKLTGSGGTTANAGNDPAQMPHRVDPVPELEHLPVFVRAGSIIPRQPLVQHTGETPHGPLELLVYPGPDCSGSKCEGSIYLDDGVSFACRIEGFLRLRFTCEVAQDGSISITVGDHGGSFRPWWDRLEFVIHGVLEAAQLVTVNGSQIENIQHDTRSSMLRFSTTVHKAPAP